MYMLCNKQSINAEPDIWPIWLLQRAPRHSRIKSYLCVQVRTKLHSRIIYRDGLLHLAGKLSHSQVSSLCGTDQDCRPITCGSKLRSKMQHRRWGIWLQWCLTVKTGFWRYPLRAVHDEAVSVVVGARLGLSLYIPHKFSCGAEVVCKKTPDRMARHHDLNYIVCRAFISAGIPSSKEPTGLSMHSGPELSAFEPVTDTEIDACYLQCHPTRHHSTCCHAVCSRAVLMCSHRS